MSKKCTVISDQSGASLISVAMFVMALGLLSAAALQLYSQYDKSHRAIETQDALTDLRAAMITYYTHNGRFPCPASMVAGPTSNNFGQEAVSPCTSGTGGSTTGTERTFGDIFTRIRIGSVPTRSMNLPDAAAVDAYGHRITYAVLERMASPNAAMAINPGAIEIRDRSGNNASNEDAVLILISHGGDERGARNINGTLLQACDNSVESGENCDFDDNFVNTLNKSDLDNDDHFTHRVVYITPDVIGK